MTPQIIEKYIDTISPNTRTFTAEARQAVSSLIDLSSSLKGFRIIVERKSVDSPIDVDQLYFWADEWQKDEQAVDDEFKKGKLKKFSNPKDAIAYLRG
ncbi:hypothetical protein HZB07_05770 [Candidatus Saganbacteria bacterium]|nr:hypothetical protein [Candidatus Saganbacteria bacterium]